MSVRATGHEQDPEGHLAQGTFKFHFKYMEKGGENLFPYCVTKEALIETAIAMVNKEVGSGEFLTVSVLGTADGELGIGFLYRMNHVESRYKFIIANFEDWFKKRHGAAYKGYSIGHNPVLITLEKNKETKAA